MAFLTVNYSGASLFSLRQPEHRNLNLDRYYDLPGFPEHRFIVCSLGGRRYRVVICRGTQLVQAGIIPSLSFVIGSGEDSEPRLDHTWIELDPNKPVFPLGKLVENIIGLEVQSWQITAISADEPLDYSCATQSSPSIMTDGRQSRRHLPSKDLTMAGTRFQVVAASWALLRTNGELNHIFLWPNAHQNTATILQAVKAAR